MAITPRPQPPSPVERPVTLYVGDQELVTLQATPANLEDWAAGFLFGEGLIQRLADVRAITVEEDRGLIWVDLPGFAPESGARRQRYLTAGCGKGVTFSSLKDAMGLKRIQSDLDVRLTDLIAWGKEMQANCPLYAQTGGVHAAALRRIDTGELIVREDIGRHNALDKAIGAALRAGWPFGLTVALTSGRISYEAASKLARVGIAVGASLTAATDQAVRLARHLGMDLVGYARSEKHLCVYTTGELLSE